MANKFLDITPDQVKQIEDASNSRSQTDQETGQVEDVFSCKTWQRLKEGKTQRAVFTTSK